jgi:hypothetical protein
MDGLLRNLTFLSLSLRLPQLVKQEVCVELYGTRRVHGLGSVIMAPFIHTVLSLQAGHGQKVSGGPTLTINLPHALAVVMLLAKTLSPFQPCLPAYPRQESIRTTVSSWYLSLSPPVSIVRVLPFNLFTFSPALHKKAILLQRFAHSAMYALYYTVNEMKN